MKTAIWVMNNVNLDRLTSFFSTVGISEGEAHELMYFTGASNSKDGAVDRDVFFCVTPETVVAESVELGLSHQDALKAWVSEVNLLLNDALARARKPLVLFVEDLLVLDREFSGALAKELGNDFDLLLQMEVQETLPSGLLKYLSAKLIQAHSEICDLRSELLEKSVLSGVGEIGLIEADTPEFLSFLSDLYAEVNVARKDISTCRQENNILLQQLQQSELELQSTLSRLVGERSSASKIISVPRKAGAANKAILRNPSWKVRGLRKISQALKRVINPDKPLVWRITSPMRSLSRPLRRRLPTC